MASNIRIGTRGSELALRQTSIVKSLLENLFPDAGFEIKTIKTTGDRILDSPLFKIGEKGLFTKEIEEALLDEHIDMAVHSCKDLPTVIHENLKIAAILEREDARDVFISHPKKPNRSFLSLPKSSVVATGSLRRKCQILNARQDIQVTDIRGNLSTRFRKLDESNWDGIILAKAGLIRAGCAERTTEILPYEIMLPSAGQGALAVEIRSGDSRIEELIRPLHHLPTASSITAERSLLHHLEGGCQVPIGAYGQLSGKELRLDAVIGSLDGKVLIKGSRTCSAADAVRIGIELAEDLLNRGGKEILNEIKKLNSLRR
ncbi:MAG: hydroxymethylbilane synthase [Bacteroidetes bacterium]|nr:hydroxymethylbilane synthase [Bacteroidota bacterium]